MKLDEIPYVTNVPRDGRALLFQPWYDVDSGQWHMYFEVQQGEFIRGQVQGMSSGTYYASGPASASDLEFPLGTLIAQHLSFPSIASAFYSLVDDIHLLSASLEKLELIRSSAANHSLSSFLVETRTRVSFRSRASHV